MNKCIQINLNGKIYKFDNVNISKEDTSSYTNVLKVLLNNPIHRSQIIEVIDQINNLDLEKLEDRNPISTFSAETVGDASFRQITNFRNYRGISNENLDKVISLLDANKAVIKFSTGSKTTIYVGDTNSTILLDSNNLDNDDIYNAAAYLYMDKQARNNSNNIYTILENGFRLLEENNEFKESDVYKALKQQDIPSRNRNFLYYLFDSSKNKGPYKSTINYIKQELNSEFNNAIAAVEIAQKGTYPIGFDKLFELDNPNLKSSDDYFTRKQLVDLINTKRKYNNESAKQIWKNLKTLNEEYWTEVDEMELNSVAKITEFAKKYFDEANESLLPEDYRDLAVLFELTDKVAIVNKLLSTGDTKFNLSGYIAKELVNTRINLNTSNQNLTIEGIDIKSDGIARTKPTKGIRLTSSPASKTIKVVYDNSIKNPFTVQGTKIGYTVRLNPNQLGKIDIKKENFKNKAYTSYPVVLDENIDGFAMNLLRGLGINFAIVDNQNPDAIKLAHEGNAAGFDITVYDSANGIIDPEIYNFITPVQDLYNPVYNFYTSESRAGYEFSNKNSETYGYNNLNEEISALPEDQQNYFELFKSGKITVLPISKKASENYKLNQQTVIYNSKNPNQYLFVTPTRITKFDGTLMEKIDNNPRLGNKYSVNGKDYVLLEINQDNYTLIELSSLLAGKPNLVTWDKNQLPKIVQGIYPASNNNILIDNKYLWKTNAKRFFTSDNIIKESLPDVYNYQIQDLSSKTGFSSEFIINKYLNNGYSFYEFNIDQNPSVNEEPVIYDGRDFAMRLANRLDTKVNFLTKNQMNARFGTNSDGLVPKGLVYDGQIYLVTEEFTPDTLFHELTHIVLAKLKELDFNSYYNLIQSLENNEEFRDIINKVSASYPELVRTDLLEEALAEIVGKSMAEQASNNELDNILDSAGLVDAIANLLQVKNLDITNIRTLMKSSFNDLVKQNGELYQQYGPIFPRVTTRTQERISTIKNTLFNSKTNNNLKEICQ